jgi:hypothetical protein
MNPRFWFGVFTDTEFSRLSGLNGDESRICAVALRRLFAQTVYDMIQAPHPV